LLDAIAGKFGPLRLVVALAFPKLDVVIGDCGINRGGGAMAAPMLVQPPSIATMPEEPLRPVVTLGEVEFDVQLGGAEVALGVVGQGGAEMLRVDPVFVVGVVVEDVNGFDEEICWFAARMPASTPSRSAVPVSENAL
jgi:hypothetical protein